MSWKACRWVLVGSVSIAMVTWVPVYRTWLRVRVARCSSRPRKLRYGRPAGSCWYDALAWAAAERRAGATGLAGTGGSWSVKVSGPRPGAGAR